MAYLLPCPQCGRKLVVTTGEAGGQVSCACGAAVDVPTVRGLRALESAEDKAESKSAWTARHSVVFLGLLIAAGGLAFAIFLHFRAAATMPNENFAEHIKSMSPSETWTLWSDVFRHGIGWKPKVGVQQEIAVRTHAELKRWEFIAYCLSGSGVLLTIAGFALLGPRRPVPPKRQPKRLHAASPKK